MKNMVNVVSVKSEDAGGFKQAKLGSRKPGFSKI